MFEHVEWLFFDIGSTIIDEHVVYERRMREIAIEAETTYERVCELAMGFYKQNKKGDLETANLLGVKLTGWHQEYEILYDDAVKCLEILSSRYHIGIIANQLPGAKERLARHGILPYIDLVVASEEEGVAKPDRRIFEIALERSNCQPNRAVMIGDRIDNDIVPAKRLGIHTVWIKQGFGQYWNITKENEKPDCTVHSLTELCDVL